MDPRGGATGFVPPGRATMDGALENNQQPVGAVVGGGEGEVGGGGGVPLPERRGDCVRSQPDDPVGFDFTFRRDRLEEFVRKLEENARTVSGIWIATAATPVIHIDAHLEGPLDEIMGAFASQVTEEADSTGIVFVIWMVKSLS